MLPLLPNEDPYARHAFATGEEMPPKRRASSSKGGGSDDAPPPYAGNEFVGEDDAATATRDKLTVDADPPAVATVASVKVRKIEWSIVAGDDRCQRFEQQAVDEEALHF